MSIRKKILLYFSVVTIALVGVALSLIYMLFFDYREVDFQQQQKEKITTTLKFLTEVRDLDEALIKAMDSIAINDLYDEKLLIFDKDKNLLYSSIDDTPIRFTETILADLSPETPWIDQKDGLYDVVGIYLQSKGVAYYGISKAKDVLGYHKLNYLRNVIIITFLAISTIVILMAYLLSRRISKPIIDLTNQIKDFDFGSGHTSVPVSESKNEVAILARRFNELLLRMNEAFSFQKHAIHHISHELKTPISVLVSNFERMENETDIARLKELIKDQKEDTKSLSEIINYLLEIAKTESRNEISVSQIRLDELIFDLVNELNMLYPDFQFSVHYSQAVEDEEKLTVKCNVRLLKAALSNLMINCIQYSNDNHGEVVISPNDDTIKVGFVNKGPIIRAEEEQFIFQHFFRGENSQGKRGFGLGLVFIKQIMALHNGYVEYESLNSDTNSFTIALPLS